MNRGGVVCTSALVLALGALPAAAQKEKTEGGMAMDAQMQEMMDRMREVAEPGEHHKALAGFLGTWDLELTVFMPGGGTHKSPGTATYEWAIEGKWLAQKLESSMMGQPYQSFHIVGFDNYAKNHVMVNVSSMDTSMITGRGVVVDPSGKETAVYGTLNEYTTGELNKPYKAVTRVIDPDHHVIEIWDLGIGTEGARVLEFRYSRRK